MQNGKMNQKSCINKIADRPSYLDLADNTFECHASGKLNLSINHENNRGELVPINHDRLLFIFLGALSM